MINQFSEEAMLADKLTPLGVEHLLSTTGKTIDEHGVNHPKHYNTDPSGVECIDIARHLSFDIGSAFKYIFRAGKKDLSGDILDSAIKDLKKSVWYIADERANFLEWTGDHYLYDPLLKAVIKSRKGHIRQALIGFYNQDLSVVRKYVLLEIERLEKTR